MISGEVNYIKLLNEGLTLVIHSQRYRLGYTLSERLSDWSDVVEGGDKEVDPV